MVFTDFYCQLASHCYNVKTTWMNKSDPLSIEKITNPLVFLFL